MARAGDRVGVMLGADSEKNEIQFLGFGELLGNEVPPEEVGGYNFGAPPPKIQLDAGQVVWGSETWWGDEDSFRRKLKQWEDGGWKIVTVDIDEARKSARTDPPSQSDVA